MGEMVDFEDVTASEKGFRLLFESLSTNHPAPARAAVAIIIEGILKTPLSARDDNPVEDLEQEPILAPTP